MLLPRPQILQDNREMTDQETPEQADTPDLAHADVGIVTALPIELNPFIGQLEKTPVIHGGQIQVYRGHLR